jgi:predicted nucleotidyltransferase
VFRPRPDLDEIEVVYTEEHWRLLSRKRQKAAQLLEVLSRFPSIVHGSVARGDVRPESDVDVVILEPTPYSILRYVLESAGYRIDYIEFVMATPKTTPKLYVYIDDPDDKVLVTIPVIRLSSVEEEFYKFSGRLTLSELRRGVRVPGVNKKLMLVIPTERGHIERCIIGREGEAARVLGVSLSVIRERIEMLTRRAEIGHTGLSIREELSPDEPVEQRIIEILEEKSVKWVLRELGHY